jgi:DNA-binding NtrC family response regulator
MDAEGETIMTGSQVVLVDNDPDLREIIGQLLEYDGHQVNAFPNATAVLEAGVLAGATVLLTEYRLEDELDGLELVSRAVRVNPRLRSAIVTGLISEQLRGQIMALPEVELFTKPFDWAAMGGYVSGSN